MNDRRDDEILADLDYEFDPIDALTTGECHRCGQPVENQIVDVARTRELITQALEVGCGLVPMCRDCTAKALAKQD